MTKYVIVQVLALVGILTLAGCAEAIPVLKPVVRVGCEIARAAAAACPMVEATVGGEAAVAP